MSELKPVLDGNNHSELARELVAATETAMSAALTTIINLAGWKDIKAITVVNCVSPVAKRPRVSECHVKILGQL